MHPSQPFSKAQAGAGDPRDDLGAAVVQTVRTPLLVLDGRMVVVAANPAFRGAFGLADEEVVGQSLFEVGRGQWNVPGLRRLLERILPRESEVRDFELREEFPGLGRRTVLLDARELRMSGDRRLILVSLEDVTETRQFERRLQGYAGELERSNRELQDFAHAASHDLQEPLRKIRTYADRLRSAIDPATLDERDQRYLDRMGQAAERMQQRIDDLLRLARVSRSTPSYARTDLSAVLRDVLDDMEVTLQRSGAVLDIGELPVVEADPAQMRLLLQNLLTNAVKFTKVGDAVPIVRVRPLDPEEGPAGTLMRTFVVEDEGIGFEQTYAEKVFEAFQRLHGRDAYEGSGVGLAICRRIVEHHHGTIRAEGRPGVGARFFVSLPSRQPGEGG